MHTHRAFLTICLLTVCALARTVSAQTGAASAQTGAAPDTLRSEFLLQLSLETQPPLTVGSPSGDKLIVSVSGGTFEGPKVRGTIANSGGDWIVNRSDGSRSLDVRIVLLTDDGAKIFVTWRGTAYTGKDGALFARIAPLFETNSPRYAWLNNVVSVGVYQPGNKNITYRVYQIL